MPRPTQSQTLTADSVIQACFKALMALLHIRHGSVRELSAVVLRQMTANILGLADSTGAAATKAVPTAVHPKHIAAVRLQALQFVQDVSRFVTNHCKHATHVPAQPNPVGLASVAKLHCMGVIHPGFVAGDARTSQARNSYKDSVRMPARRQPVTELTVWPCCECKHDFCSRRTYSFM